MRSVSTMSMPMPRTALREWRMEDGGWRNSARPRTISGFFGVCSGVAITFHQRQHLAYGRTQTHEDRAAHDAVPDVKDFEMRHDEHAGRVLIIQSVTSVD